MKTSSPGAFVAALSIIACTAHAATFEFPEYAVAIDLPDGYTEQERRDAAGTTVVTLISGDSQAPVVTLSLIPLETGYDGREEVFEMQATSVEEVLGGRTEVSELNDFDLGHVPARWGWLESAAGATVNHVGIGAAEFDDVQVTLTVILPRAAYGQWAEPMKSAFLSVRVPGEPIAAMADVTPANRPLPAELAPPSTFEHALFTVDLPAGWSGATNATDPRAINLAGLSGPTGSVTVLCLTGLGASQKTMDNATRGSLTVACVFQRAMRCEQQQATDSTLFVYVSEV